MYVHITPKTMPDLLQKNRCLRDTVQSKASLSQRSSTSHRSKCSTAETHRTAAALMLSQGFLQKPKLFIKSTVLDRSQGEHEEAGFSSVLLWTLSLSVSTVWSGKLETEFLTVHLDWEKAGPKIADRRSPAETGPWESVKLWCHFSNPQLRTHIFCRFMLSWFWHSIRHEIQMRLFSWLRKPFIRFLSLSFCCPGDQLTKSVPQ